jgi:diacylglycerol O-acyltransferase / wax synthase
MDRLSSLDAVFVNAEDGVSHMHVGSCAIFAGPPPPFADVVALIDSKLPRLPRYRQKLRMVPGGLAHPVWIDDADFSIDYHVRHTALPPPGGEAELEHLMGRLMSQELDRQRPLWETWVVEGLSDGRWALISKAHHCMVDGVSGTDMMAVLLDAQPDAPITPPDRWEPQPAPTDLALALDAMRQLVVMPVRQAGAIAAQLRRPRAAIKRAGEVAAGVRSLSRYVVPAPPLSVEGAIGPHRRYAAARCTLDEIRAIRSAFGGSVNDVVLAVISGAFRDVLLERGDPVDGVSFRSLVPVSVRRPGDSTPNNQVSLIIAELPIGVADPVARLAAVRTQMAGLKTSHQVDAGEAITTTAELAPPLLQAMTVWGVTALLRRTPQHLVNTVTTNVPGPQYPLFALGRGMLEYLPYVPLSSGVRIGIAILSYNGHIAFGVTGDYDTATDVHEMAERIEAQVHTLHELAALATTAR